MISWFSKHTWGWLATDQWMLADGDWWWLRHNGVEAARSEYERRSGALHPWFIDISGEKLWRREDESIEWCVQCLSIWQTFPVQNVCNSIAEYLQYLDVSWIYLWNMPRVSPMDTLVPHQWKNAQCARFLFQDVKWAPHCLPRALMFSQPSVVGK